MNAFGQPMFQGETYQAGIGQGYDVVTPIQLINAYAALANGGKVYRPQIVREVVGPDGKVITPFKPDLIRKLPLSQATLRTMRIAARHVVTLRHTYNLVDMPVKVAGKSGTAEFGTRDSKGRLPFHSWFVGLRAEEPVQGGLRRDRPRSSCSWPSRTTRGPSATRPPRSPRRSCSSTSTSRRTT